MVEQITYTKNMRYLGTLTLCAT